MKKILVVYYSRTGSTKALALSLSQLLHADVEEIIDTKKRSGIIGYLMAGKDAAQKNQTKIQNIVHDLSAYDVVCIGTPVWDFTMSAAIRTFLTTYEKDLPASIVFFCTQASAGADFAIQEMANIAGKKPIATLVFTHKEIEKNDYQDDIEDQLAESGILI